MGMRQEGKASSLFDGGARGGGARQVAAGHDVTNTSPRVLGLSFLWISGLFITHSATAGMYCAAATRVFHRLPAGQGSST